MTVELIELLVGLYLIGVSIVVSRNGESRSVTVDIFKLVFGVVLVLLSLMQGVRLI